MAKLNFKITDNKKTRVSTIEISATHDLNFIRIVDALKSVFDVEMYSAVIKTNSETNTIVVQSSNEERVKIIRTGVLQIAFQYDKNKN